MKNIYEIVGFSVIWGSVCMVIGISLGNICFTLEETIKEKRKAKLAKKYEIKYK